MFLANNDKRHVLLHSCVYAGGPQLFNIYPILFVIMIMWKSPNIKSVLMGIFLNLIVC